MKQHRFLSIFLVIALLLAACGGGALVAFVDDDEATSLCGVGDAFDGGGDIGAVAFDNAVAPAAAAADVAVADLEPRLRSSSSVSPTIKLMPPFPFPPLPLPPLPPLSLVAFLPNMASRACFFCGLLSVLGGAAGGESISSLSLLPEELCLCTCGLYLKKIKKILKSY